MFRRTHVHTNDTIVSFFQTLPNTATFYTTHTMPWYLIFDANGQGSGLI